MSAKNGRLVEPLPQSEGSEEIVVISGGRRIPFNTVPPGLRDQQTRNDRAFRAEAKARGGLRVEGCRLVFKDTGEPA